MKGSVQKVDIERMVAGGDGLARLGDRAVFVPSALPGERVLVELTERKRDYLRGRVVEILEGSPYRVDPPCVYYGKCGGCNLQHLVYAQQLREKVGITLEVFRRIAGMIIPEPEIEPSPPFGYRNRIQLHWDSRGRLGMMRRSSRDLVLIKECPICVPPINSLLSGTVPFGPPAAGKPGRCTVFSSGEVFSPGEQVSSPGEESSPEGWCAVEGRGETVGVRILDREILLSPAHFFQSNLTVLPELVRYVSGSTSVKLTGGTVLDLYCGVGLFGSFFAEPCAMPCAMPGTAYSPLPFEKVIGVDQDPGALLLARRNVPGEGHLFLQRDLNEPWPLQTPELDGVGAVVVDPPRSGLSPQVRELILRMRPECLTYVSCDVATLARDVRLLCADAYSMKSLRLFDFYPQSAHIEAVAHLAPK